ncbi:unnamed protein product [Closterium sp. Yama58-4]|nr:unnamed protein product [Closterium sp. Yama58-4]
MMAVLHKQIVRIANLHVQIAILAILLVQIVSAILFGLIASEILHGEQQDPRNPAAGISEIAEIIARLDPASQHNLRRIFTETAGDRGIARSSASTGRRAAENNSARYTDINIGAAADNNDAIRHAIGLLAALQRGNNGDPAAAADPVRPAAPAAPRSRAPPPPLDLEGVDDGDHTNLENLDEALMAPRVLLLAALVLLAVAFTPAIQPASAQISIPGIVNITNGTIETPGGTFGPNGTGIGGPGGVGNVTTNPDGSVTIGTTKFYPNGTYVTSDGQVVNPPVPSKNPDGSVTVGGMSFYPNGTIIGSDGKPVVGGLPSIPGFNTSDGNFQVPGFTVNPNGTITPTPAPPPPKPAGFFAAPARVVTGVISLLAAVLFA